MATGDKAVVADMIRGLFKTVRVVLAREGEALGALAEELRGDLNRTIERLDRVVNAGEGAEEDEKGELLLITFQVAAPLPFITQVGGRSLKQCVEAAQRQKLYSLCMQCAGRPKTQGWAIHSNGDLHPSHMELRSVSCAERDLTLMEKQDIQRFWLSGPAAGGIPTRSSITAPPL